MLVHCERLYESLYDLLNQHYMECAGKLYVRLAMGAQSQLCPLDPKFRCLFERRTLNVGFVLEQEPMGSTAGLTGMNSMISAALWNIDLAL